MKQLLVLGALVALILTPVAPLVNAPISKDSPCAAGTPAPPSLSGGDMLADGSPLPPCAPCGCDVCRQNLPEMQAVLPARLG